MKIYQNPTRKKGKKRIESYQSLHSLNLSKDSEVLVTPRSYFSSVSCVERVGLKPVFVDIDLKSMNISPKYIEQSITKKTRAIICVHLYGRH